MPVCVYFAYGVVACDPGIARGPDRLGPGLLVSVSPSVAPVADDLAVVDGVPDFASGRRSDVVAGADHEDLVGGVDLPAVQLVEFGLRAFLVRLGPASQIGVDVDVGQDHDSA